MSRNLQSQTKLTEFAPLSPDEEQAVGLGHLFYKFFKKTPVPVADCKRNVDSSDSNGALQKCNNDSQWDEAGYRDNQNNAGNNDLPREFQLDVSEGRSLPNVLKRISNLLALKNTGRRSYNDTELKQYWMPDSVSKECYDCGERFTTFRRRHHCRVCGQIFCARCCNQEIPGKIMNCTGDLRVCMYCGKVVLSYLQSADIGAELSADLRALHDDLQNKFGSSGGGFGGNGGGGVGGGVSTAANTGNSTQVMPAGSSALLSPITPTLQPLPVGHSADREDPIKRKPSLGYQEEKFGFARTNSEIMNQERNGLRGLIEEAMLSGSMTYSTHRHRLRNYHSCFQAAQFIDWMIQHNKAASRLQGVVLGQALLDSGYIESIEGAGDFMDGNSLYRVTPVDALPEEDQKQDSSAESESEFLASETNLPSSNSIFNLNLNLEDKTAHVSKPLLRHSSKEDLNTMNSDGKQLHGTADTVSESGVKAVIEAYTETDRLSLKTVHWNVTGAADSLAEDSPKKCAYMSLKLAFDQHCSSYLRQLLNTEGVSQSWANVISSLAQNIIQTVKPDFTRLDEMDIRQYIQFKKVSGGERNECEIIRGVASSKNIAHRAMPSRIIDPKILLLSCAIVYQRVEGKFLSLEPVIMQEQDYIGHTVARIAALGPDLVLVGRNVSRLAQEAMLSLGISLALNVKPSILERVARLTGADILNSVDSHVGRPRLGTCKLFHLRTFTTEYGSTKTLMILEGCQMPDLGCTVLLRGASMGELSKIKRISASLIFAYYNAQHEFSYLMDANACPPGSTHDSFFDENSTPAADNNSSSPLLSLQPKLKTENSSETSCLPVFDESSVNQLVSPSLHPPGSKMRDPSEKSLTERPLKPSSPSLPTSSELVNSSEAICLPIVNDSTIDQQLIKPLSTRDKLLSGEEKNNRVNKVESISDFSDPLHFYLNLDEESEGNEKSVDPTSSGNQLLSIEEVPLCKKFRKALEDNILSISPYLKFTLPYLESESGRNCALRSYFGQKIYWSSQLAPETSSDNKARTSSSDNPPIENRFESAKLLPQHKFVNKHLTEPADSIEVRALLADYRACGGRLPMPTDINLTGQTRLVNASLAKPCKSMDVLDPANHQRLSVLFCSYSPFSHNAPSFCVDPWIVDMELYGRNDIPLGAFLERYCFRAEYVCPSRSCDVAMLKHTRRFVHHSGAVHVILRQIDVPFKDDRILMWNWCTGCKTVTPITAMSPGTWSLSFAKYLELRFHGDMYRVQQPDQNDLLPERSEEEPQPQSCQHTLHHHHTQYFALKQIVVSFTFSKISMWEINLPPLVLETEREMFSHAAVLDEIKTWSLLGHQVFSAALSKLCTFPSSEAGISALKVQLQKDQAHFKARVEEIQSQLSTQNENSRKDSLVRKIWNLEDSVVLLKRQVAETVEEWNLRLSEAETVINNRKKEEKKRTTEMRQSQSPLTSDVIDGVTEVSIEISGKDSPELLEPQVAEEANSLEVMAELADRVLESDSDIVTEPEDCDGIHIASVDIKPQISDKKTVKTILSQLLPTIAHNTHIQSPMSQCEHHCLPLGYLVPVVVYEREPSSIIAYALSSHEYRTTLDQIARSSALEVPPPSPSAKRKSGGIIEINKDTLESTTPTDQRRSGMLSFLRNPSSSGERYSSRGSSEGLQFSSSPLNDCPLAEGDEAKNEDLKGKTNKTHQSQNIEVPFADGSASFKVKVYFAEEFSRLRSLVLPDGEESFVRSLSRCVQWAATGGKSGSNFSKTKDDRFILKEMSRMETQIFIDFAPQYFTYMETCVRSRAPTLLGKILGVYRVTCRNANTTCRSNLLVMEHLFHARLVTNKFDLKGSMRNRLVDTTLDSERETVLLDENLINMTCDSPLYILPHSKSILMQAIHNDTQFLATQSVMDYSLLVGLDQSNKELVVGIIDYIRTFTWDKKLETMVKRYGLLGQGKQPTIISPDEYRDRFITAMHRYFLPVPDRWTRLANGIDC